MGGFLQLLQDFATHSRSINVNGPLLFMRDGPLVRRLTDEWLLDRGDECAPCVGRHGQRATAAILCVAHHQRACRFGDFYALAAVRS
jgi:hypothetical protein